jgi:hypothetical protein
MAMRSAFLLVTTGIAFTGMGWLGVAGPLAVLVGIAVAGLTVFLAVESGIDARKTPAQMAGRGSTPRSSTNHVRTVLRRRGRSSAA